jgi:hypothetical protein
MTLTPRVEFGRFDQQEYDNTFYHCQKDHPFIAFTTCFCPLCDSIKELTTAVVSLDRVDTALDKLMDTHHQLVTKVYRTNPELLI